MRFFTGITFATVTSLLGCGTPEEDTTIDITHDVCSSIVVRAAVATDAQLTGIDAAIVLWKPRGVTQLTRGPSADTAMAIDIVFDEAAAAFRGLYDDEAGRIYINAGLADPDALAVVIAHELGHAFGLQHIRTEEHSSVMNPGNTNITPTLEDQHSLESLWGVCATQ